MKERILLFVVLMGLVLLPPCDARAQFQAAYEAQFAYFAQVDDWWTGLAIFNLDGTARSYLVTVFDAYGVDPVAGSVEFSLNRYSQTSSLLSDFIDWGSLPEIGSIWISSTGPFIVDKFTGNNNMGGFSEVQVKATPINQ